MIPYVKFNPSYRGPKSAIRKSKSKLLEYHAFGGQPFRIQVPSAEKYDRKNKTIAGKYHSLRPLLHTARTRMVGGRTERLI